MYSTFKQFSSIFANLLSINLFPQKRRENSKLDLYVPNFFRCSTVGSLISYYYRSEQFREDLHWAVYRCRAKNRLGTILGRLVRVKAGKQKENDHSRVTANTQCLF